MRVTWIQPEDLLRHELVQSAAEGKPVADIARRWAAAGGEIDPPSRGASPMPASAAQRALARELIHELDARPAAYDPDEADDLDAIRATWSEAPRLPALADVDLADRIHGAWLGRAAGCLLGKPVEGIGREGIRAILEAAGRWPLTEWFTARDLSGDVAARYPWNRASRATSLAENIDGMPEDDDLNYTLLALALVETRGHGFATDDVAEMWLRELPALRVFTAERAVYRDLLEGVDPSDAATVANPYREWIGAQIRADLYGWISPGDVRAAAEMAWRDARLSHRRSGVHGAMFVAAMCAAACVATDVATVIAAGLTVVPPRSRLATAVRLGLELAQSATAMDAAFDRLYAELGGLHWVHARNNAAALTYALMSGAGDLSPTICTAVMAGWDTDSNGATAGSIAGALCGGHAIPSRWTAPLHDRIASSVRGFDGASFAGLASRTLALARRP